MARGDSVVVKKADLAAVAQVLTDYLKDHRDKELLLIFGTHLLQHKINILEYAKLGVEEEELLKDLYEQVYQKTRRTAKLMKIFGFKKGVSIEVEARKEARKAVQELKEKLHQERFKAVDRSLDQSEMLLEEVAQEFIEAINQGRIEGKKDKYRKLKELLSAS